MPIRYETTDEAVQLRRYLYDLQGYLVVEDVLSPAQVATLNAMLDEQLPELPEDWREAAKDAPQGLYNTYRFGAAGGSHGTHAGFLEYGQPFCKLMDHPLTMELMRAQLGDCFRLDRIFGMRMREGMPSGKLHSDYGPSHPFSGAKPGTVYPQPGHQARHGFAVAAFNLTDCGPETGGLCCIPGSHNTHIRLPQCIRDGRLDEVVHVPKAPAGSVTFFTEATTHGTLKWIANHERRSLLYKYCASQLVWSRARVRPPEGIELTDRQQRLLEEPAGAHWFFESLFDDG